MSDDKIIGLRNYNPGVHLNSQPNQDVVNKLKELLNWAESGRLKAIANVYVLNDRSVGTGWCGNADTKDVAYGISSLNFRYMQAEHDRTD